MIAAGIRDRLPRQQRLGDRHGAGGPLSGDRRQPWRCSRGVRCHLELAARRTHVVFDSYCFTLARTVGLISPAPEGLAPEKRNWYQQHPKHTSTCPR